MSSVKTTETHPDNSNSPQTVLEQCFVSLQSLSYRSSTVETI